MAEVKATFDDAPLARTIWRIFGMCFGIVLIDGFDTGAIGFIAPSLLSEWHLQRAALGPVLSAALLGLACGAVFAGPISDRCGRRLPLIGSVLVLGVGALSSAYAHDLSQLTALRFVTGIGLGGALPNAVTIMSEFCPDSRRATLTNLMSCGFPLGAALGGILSAWLIPRLGWQSVFLVGGAVPLVLSLLLYRALPESRRYMAANGYAAETIQVKLAGMAVNPTRGEAVASRYQASATDRPIGIKVVLSRTYFIGSLMLWITFFMGLVIFYGSVNWMPVLLREAGLGSERATLVSTLFPLGGIGAVLSGVFMDRFTAARVIAVCYALTALGVFFIGQTVGNIELLVMVVFMAGVSMNTSQASMPALAAGFYPTEGRATGVAWMLGIGRFGGIAGSFLVAELTRLNFSFEGVFAVMATAGIGSCAALIVLQSSHRPAAITELGSSDLETHRRPVLRRQC
jgi:MFS transporter, AAHS family, 4-hydroxybenzoate transporter